MSKLLAGACVALASLGAAAQSYPAQPIRIIVPFTPGTGMDTIARVMQPELSKRLGQPVVVDNRPGASGNIGADQVAKAAGDGYTVLMGANTMLMASQIYPNVPFDPLKDFQPVSMAAWGTLMLVDNPKTGITSMKDLVARAKARPGSLTYGSPGVGTPHHMATELFKSAADIVVLHVPYKGTAGYVQDLLAGEINFGFLPVHVAAGFVKQGKLNALGVGSPKRHPVAPEVPTIAEQGLEAVNVDMWYAYFVPSKTPASVVRRLHDEMDAVLKLPQVKDTLSKAGLDADSSTPAELGDTVVKDYARWGEVIKRNNIRPE